MIFLLSLEFLVGLGVLDSFGTFVSKLKIFVPILSYLCEGWAHGPLSGTCSTGIQGFAHCTKPQLFFSPMLDILFFSSQTVEEKNIVDCILIY